MAGRLGANPAFIGKLGDDAPGAVLRESLKTAGVDGTWLRRSDVGTGAAGIFVDDAGQNCIVVSAGSNADLTAEDVRSALEAVQPSVVLVQFEIPRPAVEACAGPWSLIVNPAPAHPVSESFWGYVEAVVPNETETEMFTGIRPIDDSSCAAAAKWFLDRSVRRVILTLGDKGCVMIDARSVLRVEALDVPVVDTTAAGDAFCGALAHFVTIGLDWPEALHRANAAAALSTTKHGAQTSMPTLDEFESFLRTMKHPPG